MRRMRWVAAGVASVAVVAAVAAGLAGAGSGGMYDSDNGGALAGAGDAEAARPRTDMAAAPEAASALTESSSRASNTSTVALTIEQAAVIRTGSLALRTPDILKAQHAISGVLSALDGYLASENTQAGTDGEIRSATLVLKVPSGSFDTAMQRVSQVGDVEARTQSAKDVTREVADVDSRVASARAA